MLLITCSVSYPYSSRQARMNPSPRSGSRSFTWEIRESSSTPDTQATGAAAAPAHWGHQTHLVALGRDTAAEGRQWAQKYRASSTLGSQGLHTQVQDWSQKRNQLFKLHEVSSTDLGTQLLLPVPESARTPWRIPSSNNRRALHFRNMHMNCRDETEYLNNLQQGKTQAMRAGSNLLRDNSGFRCMSHFPRLQGDPAKVRNYTPSHVVPKAEQTKPVLTDRGRPGRAEPPARAEPSPSTELYPPHPAGHTQPPHPPCPQGCSPLWLKLRWMLLQL